MNKLHKDFTRAEYHNMSQGNQSDKVQQWLNEVNNSSTTHRGSKQTEFRQACTISSWYSVPNSESEEYKIAYIGQPAVTECQTAIEDSDMDSHPENGRRQTLEIDFDSMPKNAGYKPSSIYSHDSVSSSIKSQRKKAWSNLTGTSEGSFGKSRSQTTAQHSSSRRTTVSDAPSSRSSKGVTNHAVHIHLSSHQQQRDGDESVTNRKPMAMSQTDVHKHLSANDEQGLPPYQKMRNSKVSLTESENRSSKHQNGHSSTPSKKSRKPGPVRVARDSAGNLQLERCNHGTDHSKTGGKSHRRGLAEYIVGSYY